MNKPKVTVTFEQWFEEWVDDHYVRREESLNEPISHVHRAGLLTVMVDGRVFGQYPGGHFTMCVEAFQKHVKRVEAGVAGITDEQLSELGNFYKHVVHVL